MSRNVGANYCLGCGAQFRNLSVHQQRSATHSPCHQAYIRFLDSLRESDHSNSPTHSHGSPSLSEGPEIPPDNMLLDDEYHYSDNNDHNPSEPDSSDSEPESDEDLGNYNDDEPAWEPERPVAHNAEIPEADPTPQQSITLIQQASERHRAESHLRYQPAAVDQFPFGQPGKVIDSSTTDASYAAYQASLEELDVHGASQWAPFSSKVDWEIGCWAKMRGPGSTALDELLQIEGVCNTYSTSSNSAYKFKGC